MLVHKRTLGVLQWEWDGVSYESCGGEKWPKMTPVTLESRGLSGEEWWQVPNGTALARKIELCYPFFDPVTEGGELVGAEPWPDWKRYGEEPEETPAAAGRGRYNRRKPGRKAKAALEGGN